MALVAGREKHLGSPGWGHRSTFYPQRMDITTKDFAVSDVHPAETGGLQSRYDAVQNQERRIDLPHRGERYHVLASRVAANVP